MLTAHYRIVRFFCLLTIVIATACPSFAQQPASRLDSIGSDQSLVFARWQGFTADPNSANPADLMMADPLFADPFRKLVGGLSVLSHLNAVEQSAGEGEARVQVVGAGILRSPEIAELLYSCPGAACFELGQSPEGRPIPNIGVVFQSVRADDLVQHFSTAMFVEPDNARVEIRGAGRFFQQVINLDGIELPVVFGSIGDMLILATGKEMAESLIARITSGQSPEFLQQVQAVHDFPGRSEVVFINVAQIGGLMGGFPQELAPLNLDKVKSIQLVSGRTEYGAIQRLFVQGEPTVFGVDTAREVDFSKFDFIPSDSTLAFVQAVDMKKFYTVIQQNIAAAGRDGEQVMNMLETMVPELFGIESVDALIDHIGGNFSFHTTMNDDILGGMVVSTDVRDEQAIGAIVQRLIGRVRESGPGGIPTLRIGTIDGHTVVSMIEREMIAEPSLCVADGRIYLAMSPESLRQTIMGPGQKPLFSPELKTGLARIGGAFSNEKIIGCGYVNTRDLMRIAYPLLRLGLTSVKAELSGDLDSRDPMQRHFVNTIMNLELPPLRTILTGAKSMFLVCRTGDSGVEMEFHHSFPVTNPVGIALSSMVMSLPLAPSRESVVQRELMDQLDEIAFVCQLYESDEGKMPSDITDAEGKPLLSWRVKLLPAIGQQYLYDQLHLDEPWDSEHNRRFHDQTPWIFESANEGVREGFTTIRGFGGEHGALAGAAIKNITDGTSNTVMIVDSSPAFAAQWMKPGTLDSTNVDIAGVYGTRLKAGFVFADFSSDQIPVSVGQTVLRNLMCIDDGNVVDTDFSSGGSGASAGESGPVVDALDSVQQNLFGDFEMIGGRRDYFPEVGYGGDAIEAVDVVEDSAGIELNGIDPEQPEVRFGSGKR